MRINGLSYWGHWLILAGGFLFFILLGKVLPAGWERIELPERVDTFALAIPAWEGEPLRAQVPPPVRPLAEGKEPRTDTLPGADAPERILLVGDSMIEWLRLRLARWCRSAGYALYSVIWPSSNLIWWGRSDTLAAFLRQFKPTYVLICVGGNELFIPHIHKRKPYVERILAQIGELPYVWVGPPNWKEDTGINELIRETVGSRRFYESRRLTLERLEDGAHPTPTAAYRWADSLVVFLRDSALFPLRFPDALGDPRTALPHRTLLLSPHEP